ncbi:hypothetical protein KFK09_001633 [Dendrobium nobile]|uniref:Uncharacterized protein n=1 Tax=Dendrobium nobile TaxID=94219 RepID=A0A8T3C7X4_DENNO|nr:hypothetical protein KFK09_001633 [Dendrobium nobile]
MSDESPTTGKSLASGRNLAMSGGPTSGRSPTSVGGRGELRRQMVFRQNSGVTWSSDETPVSLGGQMEFRRHLEVRRNSGVTCKVVGNFGIIWKSGKIPTSRGN